jgi:response regulator RpfG family c-di-GMP phosphodiesterase
VSDQRANDLLVFREDDADKKDTFQKRFWKVLIVDDEHEVHAITSLVLRDFQFEGRSLEFLHAYTSREAKQVLQETPGIAVILLDVVMESEHAGLNLVHWIREEHKDKLTRIILRTGQPGAAPEKEIITKYDINDYKEKTELTDTKLWTTITVALRCYRDLTIINRSRIGLEKIVQASITFTERQSLTYFFQGVLTQLTSLLHADEDSLMLRAEGLAIQRGNNGFRIVSGTGEFVPLIGKYLEELDAPTIKNLVSRGIAGKESFFENNYYVGYMHDEDGSENLIILRSPVVLGPDDCELIRVFTSNASIALINVTLNKSIEDSQSEMIFTLGEVVESRSIETGNHVKRVAAIGSLLAGKCGLPPREIEIIRYALPLHDIGKIGITDAILNKPGKLTDEEMLEMRKHTLIGFNLLHGGTQRALQLAASIALTHHERWDGKGYPQGLAGEDIPLTGRIAGIVDVFDALLFARIYKPSWQWELVIGYLQENRGTQFDPNLVDLFCECLPEIRTIVDGFSNDSNQRSEK